MEIENPDEEYEFEQIEKMFPNAPFTIAMDLGYMDERITARDNIIIKNTYSCYCYDHCKKKTDYFYIKGKVITYQYVIEQLIQQGLKLDCNHCFLEGIYPTKGSEVQFELCIGS